MFKVVIATVALAASTAFAFPASTDDVLRALLTNSEFVNLLDENGGFKSMNLNIIWGKEIGAKVKRKCGDASASRSSSIVEVQLLMKTMPRYSTRVFHFVTPGEPSELALCK